MTSEALDIEIVAALPWRLAVVDYVLEHEALYVRAVEAYEEQGETVPVDFSPSLARRQNATRVDVSSQGRGTQDFSRNSQAGAM